MATSRKNQQSLIVVQEGASGKVDLKEDDPDIVARMLNYDVSTSHLGSTADVAIGSSMINARMYFIADKYDIGLLKDLAKTKFKDAVKEGWRSERFAKVVEEVYENTVPSDYGLRECLLSVIKQQKKNLREQTTFMELVRSGGDFAVDVIDAWTNDEPSAVKASGKRILTSYICHQAGARWLYTPWEGDNGRCLDCRRELFVDVQGKVCERTN